VAFLSMDGAKLITGETLYIDGGYHIIGTEYGTWIRKIMTPQDLRIFDLSASSIRVCKYA
jgi:enoyl-[acyl-carrier-protein] reductase (NADH)